MKSSKCLWEAESTSNESSSLTMAEQLLPENHPHHRAHSIPERLDNLTQHLLDDRGKIKDDLAQALPIQPAG